MIHSLTLALALILAPSDEHSVCPPQATCIALAVFSEARGESIDGQLAVANVVLNRGADACEVIEAPSQFAGVYEWPYPRRPERIDPHAWGVAIGVAHAALNGARSSCADADHFHNRTVAPAWISKQSCTIGAHEFYTLARGPGPRLADRVGPWSGAANAPDLFMDAFFTIAATLRERGRYAKN